jgi:hypothetical protein
MTITNFFPGMPCLASMFEMACESGTGLRNAVSTSMMSPSTDSSFTFSPLALHVLLPPAQMGLSLSHILQAQALSLLTMKETLFVMCWLYP